LNQILKRQTSRFHYGSKIPTVTITAFKYRNKIIIFSSLKHFNRATHNYGLYLAVPIRKQNVSRYQRDNQKPQIEEQTIQWLCGKTTIYKTLRRKLQIEQYEPHQKPGLNSAALDG
jgi:hypothetical protein